MTNEFFIPTDRSMLVHVLLESDPEEVCSLLRVSSRELLEAFPKRLDSYVQRELTGENASDWEEDDDIEY